MLVLLSVVAVAVVVDVVGVATSFSSYAGGNVGAINRDSTSSIMTASVVVVGLLLLLEVKVLLLLLLAVLSLLNFDLCSVSL